MTEPTANRTTASPSPAYALERRRAVKVSARAAARSYSKVGLVLSATVLSTAAGSTAALYLAANGGDASAGKILRFTFSVVVLGAALWRAWCGTGFALDRAHDLACQPCNATGGDVWPTRTRAVLVWRPAVRTNSVTRRRPGHVAVPAPSVANRRQVSAVALCNQACADGDMLAWAWAEAGFAAAAAAAGVAGRNKVKALQLGGGWIGRRCGTVLAELAADPELRLDDLQAAWGEQAGAVAAHVGGLDAAAQPVCERLAAQMPGSTRVADLVSTAAILADEACWDTRAPTRP